MKPCRLGTSTSNEGWQPDLINGGEMFGSATITPPTAR